MVSAVQRLESVIIVYVYIPFILNLSPHPPAPLYSYSNPPAKGWFPFPLSHPTVLEIWLAIGFQCDFKGASCFRLDLKWQSWLKLFGRKGLSLGKGPAG